MLVAMIAGSDTTAGLIRSTMLHLMANPRVYQKLKETVRGAVRGGTVSSPIQQEDAKKNPYIQVSMFPAHPITIFASSLSHLLFVTDAVHLGHHLRGSPHPPPRPIAFSKSIPPSGDIINRHFIPGGTSILGIIVPFMRFVQEFGDGADIFRPERSLEVDDKTRAARERLVELRFGYGRFRCAG